jgi:ketosteroid isomerase-like protein
MKFLTPADTEQAFYEAFEIGEIAAMMSVWSKDEDITCVHPLGPRLVGRAAVEESWRGILNASIGVRFERTEIREFVDQALTIRILFERLWVPGENSPRAPIIATNAYRYSKRGWHMVLHHASPIPQGEDEHHGAAIFH